MALSKFNFNSFDLTTVASTGLAFNSSANGFDTAAAGAMTLIATNTISSGVSSSDFTSGIDSTYDTYVFKLINIHVANDGSEFRMNFRDGGSSFDATKQSTCFQASHNEAGSSTSFGYETGFDLANGTADQTIVRNIGNASDESLSGTIFLFSPSSTTFVKHFISDTQTVISSNQTDRCFVAGYCNVTAAIDGITFKPDSGNIDSGVIKMYGITK
jgi:hypothetical protein